MIDFICTGVNVSTLPVSILRTTLSASIFNLSDFFLSKDIANFTACLNSASLSCVSVRSCLFVFFSTNVLSKKSLISLINCALFTFGCLFLCLVYILAMASSNEILSAALTNAFIPFKISFIVANEVPTPIPA